MLVLNSTFHFQLSTFKKVSLLIDYIMIYLLLSIVFNSLRHYFRAF